MSGEGTFARTLVIGNSGSGKSWLATRLSGWGGLPCTALDDLHWQAGFATARPAGEATELARQAALAEAWVIEGVFGGLAAAILPRATALVWLDLPVEDCLGALRQRPPRPGEDAASRAALLAWAAEYPARDSPSSRQGHARLFESFAGHRVRLGSRGAVEAWLRAGLTPRWAIPGDPGCRG